MRWTRRGHSPGKRRRAATELSGATDLQTGKSFRTGPIMSRLLSALYFAVVALHASAATTVFLNVNVVPMDSDDVIEAQTVVVSGKTIAVIGDVATVPVPEDALVVDGTDRYLLPGLGEMHAHLPPVGSTSLPKVLTLFVANGVTTIRGMLGHPTHLGLREQLADGEVFGPRLVTSGPSLNGTSVRGPAHGERLVREQHAAGYDFLKIHPGLSRGEFDAITSMAKELGMPVAGHVPVSVGVEGALNAGMATIDHLDGYVAAMLPTDRDASGGYGGFFDVLLADEVDAAAIRPLARKTAAAGTWNVPTQSLIEHRVGALGAQDLASRPEMRFVAPETLQQWLRVRREQERERGYSAEIGARLLELRRALLRALHEEGAGLLLGSDAPQVFNVPGFSVHHELRSLVAAGLTPYEALRTGTIAVAEFLGSNTGSIAVGRDADLVLLDADPLEDIDNTRRIHGVMLQGVWHPATELAQRMEALRPSDGIAADVTTH